jgi:hypothetical protein
MRRSVEPTALVVCATLPRPTRSGACAAWLDTLGGAAAAVTWAADTDTLAAVADAARSRGLPVPELALAVQPSWLDSRATLRRMVAAARQAVPGLDAAILRGPRPLAHQSLLAEEGIRVVVVDAFADAGRGSRRPAPAGWRCRNPVWGLWEVQVDPSRPTGMVGWLLHGSMPRPRPGALHVLHAGDMPTERPVSGRLDRWLAWAERRAATGRLRTVAVTELPALLVRGGEAPVSGSVLKAA